jgi:ADP-ribosylglycohydrolase
MTPVHEIPFHDRILGGLWGAVVGDALGVPVEFTNRTEVQANPVTEMRGYGTQYQQAGTWSDDGSLLVCTVESLINYEFDTTDMGRRFAHLTKDLSTKSEDWIVSTGYVIHTLTASLWCLLTTKDYRSCVLKAVNLGGDTDTTGCVAGGLAGVAYGKAAIPEEWINQLARSSDLETLFARFVELR